MCLLTLAGFWPRSLKLAVAGVLGGGSEEDAAALELAAIPPRMFSAAPSIEGKLPFRRKPELSCSTGI